MHGVLASHRGRDSYSKISISINILSMVVSTTAVNTIAIATIVIIHIAYC